MAYIERTAKSRNYPKGGYKVSYRAPNGRERSQTFARRIDAERFITSIEHTKLSGSYVDRAAGRITLDQFIATEYRKTQTNLAPSTLARDESYIRTHISPVFGAVALSTIDYTDCQGWVNDLAENRAPATVVKVAQIMGKIMKAAVRSRRVVVNPMNEVILPSIDEPDDVYLTPAQVARLADAMTSVAPQYRALVFVGCYAGPRIGELCALQWSDFDALHRTLSITRGVVEVSGYGVIEGSTKTKAGRRRVTLPSQVVAELEAHRTRFAHGPRIFPSPDGKMLRPNQFRPRQWAAAVDASGLDPVPTPHDMRHTAVSLWVAAGANDLEVAKWAGHRSAAFTKSRYAHLFPEHGDALAERLGAFIESATATPAALPLRQIS